MSPLRARTGFVLVTVIWVIAAGATFVTDAGVEIALDMRAATHRIGLERAYWHARGCGALLRTEVDQSLARAADEIARARIWDELDRSRSAEGPSLSGCTLELEAGGMRLPINATSESQLRRLATAIGSHDPAEVISSAILTRRRASPFIDARELRTVLPSQEDAIAFERFVSADSARLALNHAPREALLALGGLPAEAVERLLRRRAIGFRVTAHQELEDGISEQAAEFVRANMPALAALATVDPDWWTVRIRTDAGSDRAPFTLEERLVRTDRGTAVLEVRLP